MTGLAGRIGSIGGGELVTIWAEDPTPPAADHHLEAGEGAPAGGEPPAPIPAAAIGIEAPPASPEPPSSGPSHWAWRFIQFPPVRLVLALVFLAFVLIWTGRLLGALFRHWMPQASRAGVDLATLLPLILVVHLAYLGFVRFIERRRATELELRPAPRELGTGALWGCGLLSALVGLIALCGMYHVSGFHPLSATLAVLSLSISSGYFEELLTRGVFFRLLDEWLGTRTALVLSALFFGFAHGRNPNATLVSSLSIALSAGVLLAAAFLATRRLWVSMGLHFGWNFTQGAIYGVPISGFSAQGILDGHLSGPQLLSGGRFGPEASVFVLPLGLIASFYFLSRAARQGEIHPPSWRRRRAAAVPATLAREEGGPVSAHPASGASNLLVAGESATLVPDATSPETMAPSGATAAPEAATAAPGQPGS